MHAKNDQNPLYWEKFTICPRKAPLSFCSDWNFGTIKDMMMIMINDE